MLTRIDANRDRVVVPVDCLAARADRPRLSAMAICCAWRACARPWIRASSLKGYVFTPGAFAYTPGNATSQT